MNNINKKKIRIKKTTSSKIKIEKQKELLIDDSEINNENTHISLINTKTNDENICSSIEFDENGNIIRKPDKIYKESNIYEKVTA
jgi:hypothetical protein